MIFGQKEKSLLKVKKVVDILCKNDIIKLSNDDKEEKYMNVLIERLNEELRKHDLAFVVTKETNTLFRGYIHSLYDYVARGDCKDYSFCKKLRTTYKKDDLHTVISLHTIDSFCNQEAKTYEMAKQCNLI